MASAPTGRQLRTARTGVSLLFVCFGMSMATWAVHLPSVQRATGMSTAMVSTILLVHLPRADSYSLHAAWVARMQGLPPAL
jgi:hypothetical protein